MSSEIDRKIAVILVADVVGYSKHMEEDENATLKAYTECEKILKTCLKKYKGSIFNTAGDSALAEFPSAVNAVECGVAFQNDIRKRNESEETEVKLEFRIGINMGDVVKKEGNLFGDGVNIASRLEALAQPNGISISKSVYDLVVPKTKMTFNDLGVQKVKQNEFHAFDILLDPSHKRTLKTKSSSMIPIMGSIAAVIVLGTLIFAFLYNGSGQEENKLLGKRLLVRGLDNLSANTEFNYLSKGIQNQLISSLSPTIMIPVVSKNETDSLIESGFTDEKLGKDHNIGFILSGSILVQGKQFRVTMDLIDVHKNQTAWNYVDDFLIEEAFTAQDNIEFVVRKAIQEKFTMGVDFSDAFVKYFGKDTLYKEVLEAWIKFQKKDDQGSTIDYSLPFKKIKNQYADNSMAHLLYAVSAFYQLRSDATSYSEGQDEMMISLKTANDLDPQNPMVYPIKAYLEFYYGKETDQRSTTAYKGLDLQPNNYFSLVWTGHAFWDNGGIVSKFDPEILFNADYFEKAVEIAPYGPLETSVFLLTAYVEEKKLSEANQLVEKLLTDNDKRSEFWGTLCQVFLLYEKNLENASLASDTGTVDLEIPQKILFNYMAKNNFTAENLFERLMDTQLSLYYFEFFNFRFYPAIQKLLDMEINQVKSKIYND